MLLHGHFIRDLGFIRDDVNANFDINVDELDDMV